MRHAISLAETQGSEALRHYLEKLAHEGITPGGSKASQRLGADPSFQKLIAGATLWKGELHQKLDLIGKLVQAQLTEHPDSRIIVFATYRDTVQNLVNHMQSLGIHAERFVGQATKDTQRGLTQKKQIEALQKFRRGEFKVLIATSVGEEGLDVPSTDMVIFYEAVPSGDPFHPEEGEDRQEWRGEDRRFCYEGNVRRGISLREPDEGTGHGHRDEEPPGPPPDSAPSRTSPPHLPSPRGSWESMPSSLKARRARMESRGGNRRR